MTPALRLALALLLGLALACSEDSGPLVGDGGTDAGFDAGLDGGDDAGLDGGFDGGVDAGLDAGLDGGFDGGFDAGFDAGTCPFRELGAPVSVVSDDQLRIPTGLVTTDAGDFVLVEHSLSGGRVALELYPVAAGASATLVAEASHIGFSRIATDGSAIGVVYWAYETWPDDAVFFQSLDASGALVGSASVVEQSASGGPEIVALDSGFAVSWMNRVGAIARLRILDATGASAMSLPSSFGTAYAGADLAFSGGSLWAGITSYDTVGSLVGASVRTADPVSGAVDDGAFLIPGSGRGAGCCAAIKNYDFEHDGAVFGYLRVRDYDSVGLSFYTVDTAGTVSSEVLIEPNTRLPARPRMVALESGFAAAWYEEKDVVLVQIAADGTLTDYQVVSDAGTRPELLYADGVLRVAWLEQDATGTSLEVRVQSFEPCDDGSSALDGGVADGGLADGGASDAGASDAGLADAG